MSPKEKTTFDVLIEIPKGSRNKYEYDFDLNKIRFDRMLFSSMMYPADYGFVPETLALDDDPLDVLVLGHEPTFPMCVIEVKPIGVFHMTDEKGPDEKIICVPISDPIWNTKNFHALTISVRLSAHSTCNFVIKGRPTAMRLKLILRTI